MLVVINILIADDYLPFRHVLRDFMETADSRLQVVAEAANGREALSLLKKHRVHIALIDIRMPLMDGIELTRCIRQEFGGRVVIITYTGLRSPRLMAQALQAGADLHLVKPFELFALKNAVIRLAGSAKKVPKETASVG
ncbi:MAG: response regulator [Firmicutes bacterium]|nr:response regulator [Bacillota bacterium]